MDDTRIAAKAIDTTIASLFPRDGEGAIRELVERTIVRVLVEDLDDLGIDLDEIADSVVREEFDKLTPEQQDAANGVVYDAVEPRLKELIREHVRSVLRG
jgi:hypothetical protein